MRIVRIEKDSLNNGPGVRAVVWCQGCSVKCKGCHNPETWDMSGGREFTLSDMFDLIEYLRKDYVSGVTFSGGNPLEPSTADYLASLLPEIKKRCPDKTIWLYTGYEFSYDLLMEQTAPSECARMCDVLVDGPFVESMKDATLPFRGSSNQRLIDIKKTLDAKMIIEYVGQ